MKGDPNRRRVKYSEHREHTTCQYGSVPHDVEQLLDVCPCPCHNVCREEDRIRRKLYDEVNTQR